MSSPTALRRVLAAAALGLAVASVVISVIVAIDRFPRGLFVAVCLVLALATAWHGILRQGPARLGWLTLAGALVVVALVLLISRDTLAVLLIVVLAAGAVACARAACVARVELEPVPAPSHPALIFNPRSGGGKAIRFKLADEARRRGIDPVEMVPETDLTEMVQSLLRGGADAIAVAGGDGTQALVASVVAAEGIPYACIPAGTRNHFALDLGVDRDDVVGALDAFVSAGERLVDLAEVNGHVFVNNVSLGLYADAVARPGYREAKLRTILDTVPVVAGPQADSADLKWRDPDGLTHEGGIVLLISNNVYRLGRLIGAGTRPRLSDARLGVTVINPVARGAGLLRRWSLPAVVVDGSAALPAGIDGETIELTPPLRFTVRPGALRVRIAAQHPGCSPSAGMPDGAWDGVRMLGRLAVRGGQAGGAGADVRAVGDPAAMRGDVDG